MLGNSHDRIVLPTWLRLAIESASSPLIETGFEHDFPVLNAGTLNSLFGYKGKSFSAGLMFSRYWSEMATEPNRRRSGNVRCSSTVVGCFWFSMDCEGGYANCAHGGAIATGLDEILATVALMEVVPFRILLTRLNHRSNPKGFGQHRMPTVELKIRYKRPVPLDRIIMFCGSVVKWEGKRRLCMKACMYSLSNDPDHSPLGLDDKKILVECEGVYHVPKDSYLNGTVAYDEAIKRFGRLSVDQRQAIFDYFQGTKYPISKL